MTESRSCTFGMLFKSGWDVFKSNYGVCLGFGLLYLLLFILMLVAQFAVGIALTPDQSATAVGHFAVILVVVLLFSVLISPVTCYMLYRIISRTRGDGASARSGRYGMLVAVALITQIILIPSLVCQALGDPDQYLEMRNLPTMIEKQISLETKKQQMRAAETNGDAEQAASYRNGVEELKAELGELVSESKSYQANRNGVWQGLSFLFSLIGGFIAVLLVPWAAMSILDPRENVSSVKEGLARGWQLASAGRWAIIGVYFVLSLILVASVCALVLPSIFFGLPLMTAMIPGIYLCLRGECGGGQGAEVTSAPA